jgi:predicted signal transduction protein with EAL and GGDEF domain
MDDFQASQAEPVGPEDLDEQPASDEVSQLRTHFQARLIAANLRTEAVRAGMIDLDGLKLVDLSGVHLDDDDKIVDGRKLMADLRRAKPWLFGATSTSSAAVAPASQPVRQKTAMDMTDEEYAAARNAATKYHF